VRADAAVSEGVDCKPNQMRHCGFGAVMDGALRAGFARGRSTDAGDVDQTDWIKRKIEAAEIRTDPFPYIVVHDFLPHALYQDLLGAWPGEMFFAPKNYQLRSQLNLNAELLRLPESLQTRWSAMLDIAEISNRALYEKFRPFFALKFAPLFGSNWRAIAGPYVSAFRQAQLAQYTGAAGLHPHVDSVRLVVNSFLYASEAPDPEPALGTMLYRSFGMMTTENNARLSESSQKRFLAPAVLVPYKANCLLSFLNTPAAFHGVEPFEIGERKRRIILLSPTLVKSVEAIEQDFRAGQLKIEG